MRGASGATEVFYVHTDQVGRPWVITDANDQPRWRWDTSAFGEFAANDNPAGLGAFAFNVRFPGQYYDAETRLFYNYFRDYDPQLGRYVQSDPIGLEGGINTYAYVGANPVSSNDPSGLIELPTLPRGVVDAAAGFGDSLTFGFTAFLRNQLDIGRSLDMCSAAYTAGEVASFGAIGGFGAITRAGAKTVRQVITGYTRHGLNQAISRDGRGVAASSILDAVRNPVSQVAGRNGATIYRGADGTTVILNAEGKIVTTYGVPRSP